MEQILTQSFHARTEEGCRDPDCKYSSLQTLTALSRQMYWCIYRLLLSELSESPHKIWRRMGNFLEMILKLKDGSSFCYLGIFGCLKEFAPNTTIFLHDL